MKMALAAALLAASMTVAADGYRYDYNTGNSYNTYSDSYGNSSTYGYNPSTGSTWSSRTDSTGRSSGIDSSGNSWSYDSRSGVYQNYGTGEMRIRGYGD